MVDFDAMLAETKRLQKIEELARKVQTLNSTIRTGEDSRKQFDYCNCCGKVAHFPKECQYSGCYAFQLRELLKQN